MVYVIISDGLIDSINTAFLICMSSLSSMEPSVEYALRDFEVVKEEV